MLALTGEDSWERCARLLDARVLASTADRSCTIVEEEASIAEGTACNLLLATSSLWVSGVSGEEAGGIGADWLVAVQQEVLLGRRLGRATVAVRAAALGNDADGRVRRNRRRDDGA